MSITVEFVLIDDMDMPPIVIAMDRQHQPKVTINNYYREKENIFNFIITTNKIYNIKFYCF